MARDLALCSCIISFLGSDGRHESNMENVSIPELASVLFGDVPTYIRIMNE